MSYTVYRLYDAAGDPLYVGCTKSPDTRLAAHSQQQTWWPEVVNAETTVFEAREDARAAELATIRDIAPRYNSATPTSYPGEYRRKGSGKLRSERRKSGLTQEELAAEAGVGIVTIRRIETGMIEEPRVSTLRKVARALGLRVRDLLED